LARIFGVCTWTTGESTLQGVLRLSTRARDTITTNMSKYNATELGYRKEESTP